MSIDPAVYARLREIADQLPQVPGIGKVEIANGEIVLMMSPVKRHELAVLRIARQLDANSPRPIPAIWPTPEPIWRTSAWAGCAAPT
ncbi:hypothetical protein [Kitasatospora sp. NPDC059571]|uniref:hypothetical protein n=1 Tax=Kitasatospora sp. NPDC059571 TaxID=3346871 RepID=UPI0036B2A454